MKIPFVSNTLKKWTWRSRCAGETVVMQFKKVELSVLFLPYRINLKISEKSLPRIWRSGFLKIISSLNTWFSGNPWTEEFVSRYISDIEIQISKCYDIFAIREMMIENEFFLEYWPELKLLFSFIRPYMDKSIEIIHNIFLFQIIQIQIPTRIWKI